MKQPRYMLVAGALPFIGCVVYLSYAGLAWMRYGRARVPQARQSADRYLDRFIPTGEVEERHRTFVRVPASIAFQAISRLIISDSDVIRWIFRLREFLLGAQMRDPMTLELVEQAKAWGWGILIEDKGREIVFGAVTQPWLPQPVFRSLAPSGFRAFNEPGFAKIAWTIRVDPVDDRSSILRTETRVVTTDPDARRRFRLYWAIFSAGIILIRRILLYRAKAAAEGKRAPPPS